MSLAAFEFANTVDGYTNWLNSAANDTFTHVYCIENGWETGLIVLTDIYDTLNKLVDTRLDKWRDEDAINLINPDDLFESIGDARNQVLAELFSSGVSTTTPTSQENATIPSAPTGTGSDNFFDFRRKRMEMQQEKVDLEARAGCGGTCRSSGDCKGDCGACLLVLNTKKGYRKICF